MFSFRRTVYSLLLGILGSSSLALGSTTLLANLLGQLPDGRSSSLSEEHDFEALEIRERSTGLLGGDLANLGESSPLLCQVNLLRLLIDRSGSFSTLEGQLDLGQAESLQGVNHSFEVWSVDEHAVLVCDVSNHNLLSVIAAVVNESDAAALNEVLTSWLQFTNSYGSARKRARKHDQRENELRCRGVCALTISSI